MARSLEELKKVQKQSAARIASVKQKLGKLKKAAPAKQAAKKSKAPAKPAGTTVQRRTIHRVSERVAAVKKKIAIFGDTFREKAKKPSVLKMGKEKTVGVHVSQTPSKLLPPEPKPPLNKKATKTRLVAAPKKKQDKFVRTREGKKISTGRKGVSLTREKRKERKGMSGRG